MTRINCIPVEELTDKHLVAEYRELPRMFAHIKRWKGEADAPPRYTMGKGHMKFFQDKATWLANRQRHLVNEMIARGFDPQYRNPYELLQGVPQHLCNDWKPSKRDMMVNRVRIRRRLERQA